ncbi:MAG: glutaminyl-tRNA synthase (glutamine-hydrolyzing) subunit A [Candidatus Lloydbacteria bacterium RIFCSPLOWO2_02_FULL_51_11]|uniref:Glutamyl-tRNA(Gln) amidotransferase subunit A n=1 Tax=Candidatus Lloydbacteria bacterium RIFCSPLOWO2_02_FULL_51_11 TaxID=1798667 RepID=A0A1G2DPK2_9BACT|nr:MAG: glutaminyl-tRNA synthase (glutamine-hydrolyzing) subunit A [Candidatus Lloydbacteria bacterium RIFCSPLOWO2_02_FULL_51_11]
MLDLKNLTIEKAHAHLHNGDFSARELTGAYVDAIEKKNPELNAYIEVFAARGGSASGGDDCFVQADRADKAFKEGTAGVLTGIPFAVKDNILVKGQYATCASRILSGYRATYDAWVVEQLKNEHAVFLGRTNMDEFAMGSSTEHSVYGPTRNPHDTSRVPGGSSGGSAVAVAADLALGALGSDTGGSVRQPAGFCGIVGLKPTYGAVSRRGLVALASSLDQVGPCAKTVTDAEIIFNFLNAHDPRDSTSVPLSLRQKDTAQMRKRIGVPYHLFSEGGVDKDVRALFDASLASFKAHGYAIQEITLPHLAYSLNVYYIVMPAEASTNLARFDGVRYGLRKEGEGVLGDYEETRAQGFGKEPRMRILLGSYVLSAGYHDAYYRRATVLRELIRKEMEQAFVGVDLIALPTSPSPAFKIGERVDDPLAMYLSDIFTVPANIAGVPAISLPMGSVVRDGKHLPVGIQLMASHFAEKLLFTAGKDLEHFRAV